MLAHNEIGHLSAVIGGGEVLCDTQSGGIEEGGRLLDRCQLAAGAAVQQRGGGEESAGVEEDLVTGVVGGDDDGVHQCGRGAARVVITADLRVAQRLPCPCARRDDLDPAGDVGEGHHHQSFSGPGVLVQAGVVVRFEHDGQFRG